MCRHVINNMHLSKKLCHCVIVLFCMNYLLFFSPQYSSKCWMIICGNNKHESHRCMLIIYNRVKISSCCWEADNSSQIWFLQADHMLTSLSSPAIQIMQTNEKKGLTYDKTRHVYISLMLSPLILTYLSNLNSIMALVCGMWTIHMVSMEVSRYTVYWDRSYLCLIMLVPMLGDLDWPTPVDKPMPLSL